MEQPVNPAAPSGTRATRKRTRTRASLLEAARALCAAHGYQALTVADIAAEADVGVGTFYYHFETKDDVLHALLDGFMSRCADAIKLNRDSGASPAERVRAGFDLFFRLGREEHELLQVYFGSAAARETFAETARQFFLQDTIELIGEGQAAGVFRPGDPDLLAHWWIGASSEALRWLLEKNEPFTPAGAAQLAGLLLHGITEQPGATEGTS